MQARLAWLEAQQPAPAEAFALTSGWRSNMSAAEYAEKFSRVQAYLQSGDCYQVNLAQRFQATYRGDEWQAFTRLNASNKAPFSAFVRLEQGPYLACHLSALFIWPRAPFKPVRLKAPCRALPIPTPTAGRRKAGRLAEGPRRKPDDCRSDA